MDIEHNLEDFVEFAIPDGCFAKTVTKVHHYTDRLFRSRTTRPASLRFRSGEFVMIGLPGDPPVFCAYKIVSLPRTTRCNFLDQGAKSSADNSAAENPARWHGPDP